MPAFAEDRQRASPQTFLESAGLEYKTASVMPSFGLSLESVVGTEHVACVPRRMAQIYARRLAIKVLASPLEFPPIVEVLQWHKQREREPLNLWLRESLIEWEGSRRA